MIGYVTDAIANALKTWKPLQEANVIPIRATDGMSAVVNTPLPAVAVHISGDTGEGNTFIGGGIRQYFEIALYVLLPVVNYTFSPDRGTQANVLDLSDEVIRCMERTSAFSDIQKRHDFNIQYDRTELDETYGTQGANSVVVDIHKIIYKGSVAFDPYNDKEERPTDVELKQVNIEKENENY